MAAVDKTSLTKATWDTVVDILNNTSYIKDPRRQSGIRNRKMVYRHDPDTLSYDYSFYPIIICKCPVKSKSKQSADQSTQEIQWSQQIILRTAENGSGANKDDVGVDDMVDLMDDIDQYFESTAVRKDFKDSNLNFQDITTVSAMEELEYEKFNVYETVYEITYRSRVVIK